MTSSPAEALRILDAAIGPILRKAHFADAQIQTGNYEGAAIYCAALTDILNINPDLRNRYSEEPPCPGECYDVIAHVSGNHITRIDVEGTELIDMLDEHGLKTDAETVRSAYGRPAEEVAPIMGPVLQRLFTRTE